VSKKGSTQEREPIPESGRLELCHAVSARTGKPCRAWACHGADRCWRPSHQTTRNSVGKRLGSFLRSNGLALCLALLSVLTSLVAGYYWNEGQEQRWRRRPSSVEVTHGAIPQGPSRRINVFVGTSSMHMPVQAKEHARLAVFGDAEFPYLEDQGGEVFVNALVEDPTGETVAILRGRQLFLAAGKENSIDYNIDADGLEVVDSDYRPLLQVHYFRDAPVVKMNGFFHAGGMWMVYSETTTNMHNTPPSNDERRLLRPWFRYPSWKYLGQRLVHPAIPSPGKQ